MKTLKLIVTILCLFPNSFLGKNFFETVHERQKKLNTHICLGMDPREAWFTHPEQNSWFQSPTRQYSKETIVLWGKQLIDQTESSVCCIKPNVAFYTQLGQDGLEALQEIIQYAKNKNIPVLLDAKYGDIGSTATAYARTAFEYLDADCVTVSPYLGYDSVEPFLDYENKSVFILAKTSNPSSQDIQDLTTTDGICIYEHIAQKAQEWGNRVGIVVGATMPRQAKKIRAINKDSWILAPGIGAQGGNIEKIISSVGHNVIFPMSREICHNKNLCPCNAALQYKNKIEKEISKNQTEKIVTDLMNHNVIRFGQFTLKSGALSPIYIDLRSVISYPELLEAVAQQYVKVIREKNITCDRVAGVTYGALGIAFRVADMLNKPILITRKEEEKKQYGIADKGLIGKYNKGEKILLIEDVVTTGKSCLRTAERLLDQGLEIIDAVVLLDRQAGASRYFAEKNIKMHAAITMSKMLEVLKSTDQISKEMYHKVKQFMSGETVYEKEANISLQTKLCGYVLKNPFVFPSGIWSTTSESLPRIVAGGCGAITTKSVNTQERKGHPKPNYFDLGIGFTNAMGLPGPGAQRMAEIISEHKIKSDVPIIASIFGHNKNEFVQSCQQVLEGDPDIVEVNMSCPNVQEELGTPFACDANAAQEIIAAVRSVCDKPIFAKLAPNVPNIAIIAQACVQAGADGITVINTMPCMIIDADKGKPILTNKTGGLSGQAVKPIALKAVYDIRKALPEVPIIGMGGITNGVDAIEMFMAGATAIGVGAAVYSRGIDVFKKLTKEVKQFMMENDFDSLDEIRNLIHES